MHFFITSSASRIIKLNLKSRQYEIIYGIMKLYMEWRTNDLI